MIALRPHQERALDLLREGFRRGHRRQVLVMPTGAGKTITAGAIALSARDKCKTVLFVVDRIALADQAVETMERLGLRTSVLRGEDSRFVAEHDVIVASIQTLARRHLPAADLLVVDEAHVLHKAHAALFERWNAVPTIGLTATPFTRGLGQWFTRLVVPTSIGDLTDAGLLVPVVPYGPAAPDLAGVRTRAGDYAQNDLAARMNRVELHADVVDTWHRLGESRQTLVFAVDIAHSKAVAAAFESAGVPAAHLDGYADSIERGSAIRRFRDGEIKVLCSVACLAVGFDAPNASCLVLARPTKSMTMHLQQIGRGLRTHPGKENCIVIDHAGNIERHGLPVDIGVGELDDGSRTWQSRAPRERLPRPCTSCAFLKPPGVHQCPQCGFAPERRSEVETIDAEIVALTTEAQSRSEMQFYRELLGCAREKGRAPGWAYHLFIAKTGSKPPWSWRHMAPLDPSATTRRWVKSRQIAFARAHRSTPPTQRTSTATTP